MLASAHSFGVPMPYFLPVQDNQIRKNEFVWPESQHDMTSSYIEEMIAKSWPVIKRPCSDEKPITKCLPIDEKNE